MLGLYLRRLKAGIAECLERNAQAASQLLERCPKDANKVSWCQVIPFDNRANAVSYRIWDGHRWRDYRTSTDDS